MELDILKYNNISFAPSKEIESLNALLDKNKKEC